MPLDSVLERFIKRSPVSVMARLAVGRAISPEWLDELFEAHRERQYTRELLFSTVIEMMGLVALGLRPSLHAAAKASELSVSMTAVYDKVKRVEPRVMRAMVQGSGERLSPLIAAMQPKGEATLVPGYRVRVVDGNHLPGSEKRVKSLRGFRGAALPGHSLVVYDPEQDLVVDMVPIEDAYAQERTAMPEVLERAQTGELWMGDRNFCTAGILTSLAQKEAGFIIREHGAHPNPTPQTEMMPVGRADTGTVFEQLVCIQHEDSAPLLLRRVELHLDEPTEDGDAVIRVLTNLPPDRMSGAECANLYRTRWSIEGMFQRLESALQSELKPLGQPRAALLGFAAAIVAYNVLSVLQKSLESAHPQAQDDGVEVSSYFLAHEVRATYGGMTVAVPEAAWSPYEELTPAELARTLVRIAKHANPARFRKHKRGPKKKTKKGYVSGLRARQHVSTARVLAAGRPPSTP